MRTLRWFSLFYFALFCFGVFLCAIPAQGADFEYREKIEAQDGTSYLLAYYVQKFTPEELLLVIDEQHDDAGRFRDLYMDLTGVMVEGVRLDRLTFRMLDVRFNAPSEWAAGNVECKDALQVYVNCLLREDDLNRKLATETFGGDDHWRNISMEIRPSGLYARGTYVAKVLFVKLNILIEVESRLKVVKNKELWLDNYVLRVNRLDVPGYVTRKAVAQIQPLLDLGRVPLPLKLHSVTFETGRALFSTRIPPRPIEGGITYRYQAK